MIVFLNGEFVAEEQARVSVFDRSFQYGDGLFETVRISRGNPFRWTQHMERMERGAKFLGIRLPFGAPELRLVLKQLVEANRATEAMLRISLSRGVGVRGYSPAGADHPVLVMSLHPADPLPASPVQWKLVTSSLRLSDHDPLTRWKTGNKLLQVLARGEAEQRGADEALLLNTQGELCEAASGNLFWIEGDTLHTPPADAGLLPGVTRGVILKLAPQLGLVVRESRAGIPALVGADGAFLTLSSMGLIEIVSVDGILIPTTRRTQSIYKAYRTAQEAGTAGVA